MPFSLTPSSKLIRFNTNPMNQLRPSFDEETKLAGSFGSRIAGIDEAGRGPWAGPVVAAAVILDPDNIPDGLNDSKQIKAGDRDRLFDQILNGSDVGIGIGHVGQIDRDNILQTTLWTMGQAVADLTAAPDAALVDGNKCPELNCPVQALVKGDGLSLSVAAASIIAKVTRDRIMVDLARNHPGYGWERNKGYGTAEHHRAIYRLGVTAHHRRSFKPVRAVLNRQT